MRTPAFPRQTVPESRIDCSTGRVRYLTNRPLAPASVRAAVHAEIRLANAIDDLLRAGRYRAAASLAQQFTRFAA